MSRSVSKEVLQDLAREQLGYPHMGYSVLENEICGTSRWATEHRLVFRDTSGRIFEAYYRLGATEHQDEQPFENDPDQIECRELEAVQVTVTKFVPKKEQP